MTPSDLPFERITLVRVSVENDCRNTRAEAGKSVKKLLK